MTKPSKANDKSYYSLRSFLSYMGQYKLRFAIVIFCFTLSNIALDLIPIYIGKLVGALSAHPVQGHSAVVLVWVLIVLSSGHDLIWRCSEFLHMKLINPLSFTYETLLFREIVHKPYPYFVDKFTGKLSSYINTIRTEQKDFFDNLAYNYVGQIIALIVAGGILSSINWQTGVLFLIGVLLMFVIGRYTVRNSLRYEKKFADINATKSGKLVDAIANFVNIKSFGTEMREYQQLRTEQVNVVAASNRSYVWSIVFWGSMSFIIRELMWPATIGLNVYLFLHHQLTIAQLATVLSTILIFTSTVWDLIWFVSQFNLKIARVEEAHRYLFGKRNIGKFNEQTDYKAPAKPVFAKSLVCQDLHFAYPDKLDTPVLKDINLTIKRGEKIGIVGKSGSGKTTLTKLLLGYYPVPDNGILLDGHAVPTRAIAQLISYVPQDTTLFHRSIAENIAYAADGEVTRQQIVAAAKEAHADEFIAQISDGYDAMVGERGVKLSAGQRQRIAIARALLDDKPLLVLDEATSALDSESEVLVQQGLEALWEDKTVIAIAHRLSTLRHMDRILVMDQGRVVEQGTHEALLAHDGIYTKLWKHQSGGFIKE